MRLEVKQFNFLGGEASLYINLNFEIKLSEPISLRGHAVILGKDNKAGVYREGRCVKIVDALIPKLQWKQLEKLPHDDHKFEKVTPTLLTLPGFPSAEAKRDEWITTAIKGNMTRKGGIVSSATDNQDLHAEMRVLQYLAENDLFGKENFYLGVSKRCCEKCEHVIKAVNDVFGVGSLVATPEDTKESKTHNTVIKIRGEGHPNRFPAQIPPFLCDPKFRAVHDKFLLLMKQPTLTAAFMEEVVKDKGGQQPQESPSPPTAFWSPPIRKGEASALVLEECMLLPAAAKKPLPEEKLSADLVVVTAAIASRDPVRPDASPAKESTPASGIEHKRRASLSDSASSASHTRMFKKVSPEAAYSAITGLPLGCIVSNNFGLLGS
ncbi:hypothetical protein BH10PSE19_BH10PSE19_22840 [soil metagenome]